MALKRMNCGPYPTLPKNWPNDWYPLDWRRKGRTGSALAGPDGNW